MKNRYLPIICGLLPLIFISSCFPVKTTTNTKRSTTGAIYNPQIQQLHPGYFVFHAGNEQSRLYTKFNLSELMFSPIGPNKTGVSKVRIEYRVYPFDDSKTIADSASVVFDVKKRKGENSAITYLNLQDKGLLKYHLHIITTDLLKQSRAEDYIFVNKENTAGRQDFMVSLKTVNYPYFYDYFRGKDSLFIQFNKPADKLVIRYYQIIPPLPYPPFSAMTRQEHFTSPDSVWTLKLQNSGFDFTSGKRGLFYIQTDTTQKAGLPISNFGENFPMIKTTDKLIEPLEYLLSTGEYSQIKNNDNKKLAVDNFWLSCGKTPNRARELIRIYYNRTFYSNLYFTSFTEGWRTDRGMIYIMFGPPRSVKKSPDKEIWYYSDRLNSKYLQFVFNKTYHPLSDNDYLLERSIDFKPFWFEAINSWKTGTVYNVFE